jgi:Protein of unknown function (DUF3375)
MHYDEIAHLQAHHPTWALLRSPHAPLLLSFLGRVFVDANAGASGLRAPSLADQLEDELYALNERLGADTFPRPALAYLDEWAAPDKAWLRKFYQPGSDEAFYDLTPPVEKALLWVRDLRAREFVGTESRLNTVFDLLRQMVFGADADPESRLVDLRRRRSELDLEIARAERGEVALLDHVSQRDRYQQFARNARELLADFREVEENFRALDRSLREQIAAWSGSKGELLDEVLGSRSSIAESDQGRSFQALYDFLLSHQRQEELTDLLERLMEIDLIADQEHRLSHIHFDWIDAGERTQTTVRQLSEQLRRFLDDQVWLENRRVFDLLRSIEGQALSIRQHRQPDLGMELDDTGITVNLPFERPLYVPQRNVAIEADRLEQGSDDVDASALLDQIYVDRDELSETVRKAIRNRGQLGLSELVGDVGLQHGLAELVGYLSLTDSAFEVVFDEERRDLVEWDVEHGTRVADVPRVTFSRRAQRSEP